MAARLIAPVRGAPPQPSPDGAGLGQVVRLGDGHLVVTRLGYGTRSDVVVVATDGTASVLVGLDTTRRRIGLALAPDCALYTAWFTRTGQSPRVGAVGRLTIDPPSEVVVIERLSESVGVLATENRLIVRDQDLHQLLVSDRDGAGLTVRAAVDAPKGLPAVSMSGCRRPRSFSAAGSPSTRSRSRPRRWSRSTCTCNATEDYVTHGVAAELDWSLFGRREPSTVRAPGVMDLGLRIERRWLGVDADDLEPGGGTSTTFAAKWWPTTSWRWVARDARIRLELAR